MDINFNSLLLKVGIVLAVILVMLLVMELINRKREPADDGPLRPGSAIKMLLKPGDRARAASKDINTKDLSAGCKAAGILGALITSIPIPAAIILLSGGVALPKFDYSGTPELILLIVDIAIIGFIGIVSGLELSNLLGAFANMAIVLLLAGVLLLAEKLRLIDQKTRKSAERFWENANDFGEVPRIIAVLIGGIILGTELALMLMAS